MSRRLAAAAALLLATAPVAGADEINGRRGKQLFDRPWLLSEAQDPVGPLFNALLQQLPPGGRGQRRRWPGPGAAHGRRPNPRPAAAAQAIEGVAAETMPLAVAEVVMRVAGGELRRVQWELGRRPLAARLAPPLRGLVLLALVPEVQLRTLADPDDRDGDGVSGCSGSGRFGLKAERARLAQQIGDALALDMCRATADHPSTEGDCTLAQTGCLRRAGAGRPVPDEAVARLLAYLEALRPRLPPQADASDGARLFAATGCGTCHAGSFIVPSNPAVTGRPSEAIAPFTDLLLHDLSDGLADPFPAGEMAAGE